MESQILIVAVAGPCRGGWRRWKQREEEGENGKRKGGDVQRKRKDRISYLRYETAGGEGSDEG